MRIELQPELPREASYPTRDQQPELLLNVPGLRVIRLQGILNQPWVTCLRVCSGHHAMKLNLQGSLLVSDVGLKKQLVCPNQSVLFVKGPVEIPIGFSRGHYEHYLITWQSKLSLALSRWVDLVTLVQGSTMTASFYVSSAQASSIREVKEKLLKACHSDKASREPLICGYLHEIVTNVLEAKNEVTLAPVPAGMPSFLEELLKRVKYEAAYGWSLKKAAEFVGYSPFHLSRTFKAFMGYGFPEFVDRARVELAIKYLSESVHSVDQVATLCGYCSTHGLREAMKQYVGFLPSEIRMLYPLAAFG